MIHTGDCIEVMAGMDADSVDAIVTDPPYALDFMGKKWDSFGTTARRDVAKDKHAPNGSPFYRPGWGQTNTKAALVGFQAWCEAWGREALRVTKPGGYLLAFGGTRTHHRLVCGLEDAGWIIRDELDWIYASGFPKGKANLKPAHEPIVLARKPGPLQALAIDECRIGTDGERLSFSKAAPFTDANGEQGRTWNPTSTPGIEREQHQGGRWPSNVLLSDPALFDERNAEVVGSGAVTNVAWTAPSSGTYDASGYHLTPPEGQAGPWYGDSGGYSRFFIVPKADRADREPVVRNGNGKERENGHPTVKPTDLMRHLVRLVTPQGGTVLDCFLGSGSTALAAELEGFSWIGIEKEPEYVKIAEARLHGTQRGLGLEVS